MKYNTTYSPNQTLLETLQSVSWIKEEMVNFITSKFNLLKVTPPLFFSDDSLMNVEFNHITRTISFDFGDEYKVATMALSHTNWMRWMLNRTKLKVNEGIWIDASYVWRDIHNDSATSSTVDEITFQFLVKDIDAEKTARDMCQDIYEKIYELAMEVEKDKDIQNFYPSFAEFATAQELENEMSSETFSQREMNIILEKNAFILEAPGRKLYSGKTHSYIPPMLYDHKNYYKILMKDKVNSKVLDVCSVAITSSGQQLTDQLHLNNMASLLSKEFYINLSRFKDKIIEVKLNIPRIAMAILSKGHIGEVQAGVISDESNFVAKKHKVGII